MLTEICTTGTVFPDVGVKIGSPTFSKCCPKSIHSGFTKSAIVHSILKRRQIFVRNFIVKNSQSGRTIQDFILPRPLSSPKL